MKKSVYFAHPFDTWKTELEQKIADILRERGYDVVNPLDKENCLNEKYGVFGYYEQPSLPFAHDIVKYDFEMLTACDEYFGWLPKGITIVGTVVEMIWACRQGKPVTVLSYKPNPFLLVYSDKFFASLEDFIKNHPSWIRNNPKDPDAAYYFGIKERKSTFVTPILGEGKK
ncbi:MAG: hypothetical protein RBG13Loki_1555 [Promethearchaeota archaeon CR_4]|nr:MAG: hypothetical protein RBG13Loki_1555 [Candidatus Lokiarchaeota archaeon CR_4]